MTFPLPPGARRLWFAEAFADGAPLHNNPAVFRLTGPLSADALRRAADLVAARHPVLRTTFDEVDGEPVGRTGPVAAADVVVRAVPAADAEAFATRAAREPFDLRTGPLFRVRLGRITPTDNILVINTHHAVVDGRSLAVLCGEIGALYADPGRALPDPGAPPDTVDHDPSRRVSDLAGVPDLLTLPTDRPRPRMRGFRGELRRHPVPAGLTARVDALARATRATRFVVLHAAYAATLGTTAGQDDVVAATLVSGRPGPESADAVGMFVNPVPLRVRIGGDPTFRELVARARGAVAAGLGGAAVPFDRIVEAVGAARDPSHAPLCQAHLVMQDPPEVVLPGVRADRMLPDTGTADVDLTVMVESGGPEMTVVTEHDTDLFDGATVDGFAGRLLALLDRACADPDRRLSALTAGASAVAESAPPTGGSAGPAGAPAPSTVLELIRFDAEGLAVGELSYAELERRSAALASVLRSRGAGPEVWVAVDLPRGRDLVVAVLGIWRAGAVYVPVEPSWPGPRRRAVTGAARIVLTGIPELPQEFERVEPGIAPESLAYVLHTSGSTGSPKAVGVPHRAVAGMLARSTALVGLRAGDVVAALISPAFDISVWELVAPLTVGARVAPVPPETVVDGPALARLLKAEAVTVVQVTPSVWAVLAAAGGVPECVRVRVSIGEVLTPELAGALGGAELWNTYGPTETTIWSTAERVHRGGRFGIGDPLDGVARYLLNAGLRPVDDDVVGEVYLGGFPLARGYLGAPGRSATRFVADPFSPVPGARMYATGDLARRRPGGLVEFVGRADAQLKVRGHRVEPAEVEAALRADPEVADARVTGDGDRLVAYVIPAAGRPRWTGVRERLSRVLPAYLVPSAMVTVDAFPLTSSGKLNVRALPPPAEDTAAPDPHPGLETTIAEIFAGLLARPVGRDDDFFLSGGHSLAAARAVARIAASTGAEVTVRTLFAHPTVAALAAAIDAGRGDPGTPEEPGAAPATPGGLSGPQRGLWAIHQAGRDDGAYVVHAAFRLDGALDEADLRAGFTHTLAAHPALRSAITVHEGVPRLSAEPCTDALSARAWRTTDLSARTDPWPEAERLAARDADRPFDLTRPPLVRAHLIRTAPTTHLLTLTAHHIICDDTSMSILLSTLTSADPIASSSPGGAADVRRTGPGPGAGPSLRARTGAPEPPIGAPAVVGPRPSAPPLGGPRLSAPVVVGPRRRTTDFWAETLRDAPSASGPAPDHPYGTSPATAPDTPPHPETGGGPAHPDRSGAAPGATHRFTVPAGLARRFATRCRGEGATTFAGLLAVLAIVSATRDGGDDLVVGTPVSTRPDGWDDVIGMFVTTLPLRLRTNRRATPRDLLADATGAVADAMDHADIAPADILTALPTPRGDRDPLFRTMLVLNRETAPVTFTGLTATPLPIDRATSRFDLTLHIREREGDWLALIDYRTDRYEADTITGIADQVLAVMEAVARHPGRPLSHLDLLSPADSAVHTALGARPDPAFPGGAPDTPPTGPAVPPRPAPTTVVDLIAARTARTPDAIAVLDLAAAPLTYRDLDRGSSAVARHLREAGIRSEDPVALTLPAGADAIIAILGVLKAGGCFVPLDPDQPPSRRQALITAVGATTVLTRENLLAIGRHESREALLATGRHEPREALPTHLASTPVDPSQLAYVVHTSGSTGEPKGVEVQHDTLLKLTTAFIAEHGLTAGHRLLMVPPAHFDAAFGDIFPVLAAGATLVTHPDPGSLTGPDLLALCVEHRLSAVDTAAPLWQRWVADLAGERLPLEIMMVGGDTVPAATARAWAKHGVPLHNHYGPTEATVCATSHRTVDGREHPTRLPIGRPLPHVRVHLLDRALRRVPVGVVGEIYIGGTAPARGYRGQPAATAAAFLADPYADRPGARMYRTGDLARLNRSGTLEFVGRADDQVKIRGNRVEPGEVAAVLAAHPAVAEAVVVADGDRLIGYVGAPAPLTTATPPGPWTAVPTRLTPGTAVPTPPVPTTAIPTPPVPTPPVPTPPVPTPPVPTPATPTPPAPGAAVPTPATPTPPGTPPAPGTATPTPASYAPPAGAPDAFGLRAFCADRLPAYLVPDTVVVLDALPTTSTGKVDTTALPEPPAAPAAPADPPRTATEGVVAAIWATVLHRSDVDRSADFFALGGHSLIAAHVLAAVRDRLGVTVPMRTLFAAPTVAAFAAVVDDGVPADLPTPDRLRADAVPPPEIRLRAAPAPGTRLGTVPPPGVRPPGVRPIEVRPFRVRPPGVPSAGRPRRILLTGATGFLGRHLLDQLLARTDARIHCLVRRGSIDRLPVTDRVIPVPGDLAAPGLGLSTEDHDTLTTVDAIYHNAAVPHFAASYDALKSAHVDATAAILRLAGDSGAPLHLTSTLGVFLGDAHDGRVVTEADVPTDPSGLTSGYDLSKWVADAMAVAARGHGLPVSVHRIAAIVGDTVTGATDPRSAFSRWLTGCVAAGAVPDTAEVLDMVPVDTVAAAIVALSQAPELLGRDHHYHGDGGLTRAALAAALTSAGHPTEVVPYGLWRERMLADPAGPFAPLAFSLPEHPRPHPRFDCSRTWAAAAGAGVGFPPADERMLRRHLDGLTGAGALSGNG
ncbi:amino acid adenylation domain-containing protein [Streptomyces griseus]|uniref:non-ribosomal peptide synthetase n=1 Tax=Streptomyces griseus TaxID=1911 RepID=UPI00332EB2D2